MRNFISPIIIEKKPEFLRREYRDFSRFIDHFYTFLEERGNPLEVLETFYENCEANNQVDGFIDKILLDCGFDIKNILSIPKKELIIHLRDFYLSRGSEVSFKFLFKVLYGVDVTIDYPRKRLFIPSQATYSGRYFVYTTTNHYGTVDFDTIMSLADSYELVIRGISSKVECAVEGISLVYSLNKIYLRIQVDDPYRFFQKGEGIEIYSQDTDTSIIENFVDNVGISIDSPGKGYAIGDKVLISNTRIIGNARVRTLKEGSISDVVIIDGGDGYAVGDQILTPSRSKGHSFSAVVSQVDTTENYLSVPNHSGFNLSSGDFTVEAWIYMPVSNSDAILCTNQHPTDNKGWSFKVLGSRKLSFQMMGAVNYTFTSTRKIRSSQWTHVAVTRSSNTIRLFVDGVESSRDTVASGVPSSEDLMIGLDHNQKYAFVGYMDELRITKGLARYIAHFTLPAADFDSTDPDFASVTLLMNFDGINNSTTFTDESTYNHIITGSGSIFISNSIHHFGDTSGYFSGLGAISKVTIYNHGYGYDEIPTLDVKSNLGLGANLLPMSDNIGQIESIEIIDPFVDSYATPTISVISKNGTGAVLTTQSNSVFSERPSWKSMEGMLGVNSTLLDSYYYQQFSYYTYSPIPRKESDAILDEWCHPSGFVRFAILDISFSDIFRPPSGGFDGTFYITIIKNIFGYDHVYMVNPIYNLHWFKELSDKNYMNWVGGYDWIQEEWTADPRYYISQALDIYPVTKYRTTVDYNHLVNPQSGLNWFKECQDNYSYTIGVWDDMTCGDPPLGTTDAGLLSRKRVNDDSLIMDKALDAEIEIISV